MLYEIVKTFPNDIINEEKGPFISLYQPTHRRSPENKQDIIRFKNLVNEIENSLKEKHSKKDIESLLKPFYALAEDKPFWNTATDGLAILAIENKCVIYQLQRPVKELVVVGESFHIKPLIRNFQSADRYHLLGLNRQEFSLYEGNRYGFEEIKLDPEVLRTLEDVIGDEYTEPHLSGGSGRAGGAGVAGTLHGHGGRKDEINKDIEKYFRYVDKFILDNYSNFMKIPIVLVALDENQGFFRTISNNPYLLEEGIKKDYKALSKEQLKENAWKIIEPFYLNKTKVLTEKFEQARSQFLASDDLSEISRAIFNNRVETLILEADRIVPGKINKETGELRLADAGDPEAINSLDELAYLLYKNKGEIIILPKERIPSSTGAAAIYRY